MTDVRYPGGERRSSSTPTSSCAAPVRPVSARRSPRRGAARRSRSSSAGPSSAATRPPRASVRSAGCTSEAADGFEHLSNGIAREWAEGLSASGWGLGPIPYKETAVMPYVPWGYKRLADRLVARRAERSRRCFTRSSPASCMSGRAIEAVVIATKQGPKAIRGRVFVDATGDADVVFHAGGRWEMGEPGACSTRRCSSTCRTSTSQAAMEAGLGLLAEKINEAYDEQTHDLTRAAGAVIPTMRAGRGRRCDDARSQAFDGEASGRHGRLRPDRGRDARSRDRRRVRAFPRSTRCRDSLRPTCRTPRRRSASARRGTRSEITS